jgi:hypothetical protein
VYENKLHVDVLVTRIKERHEKDMKDQGVSTVEDISNDSVLWYLPFKICEELFDIRGRELDQIFVES